MNRKWFSRPAYSLCVVAVGFHSWVCGAEAVDYRYSPADWQTAICLPDDPIKSLVSREGELLYHFGAGKSGGEFAVRISVEAVVGAKWRQQTLLAPRIPIVRTEREADGLEVLEEAFATTAGARSDIIRVHVINGTKASRILHPRLIIDTTLPFEWREEAQDVRVNGREVLTASLKMMSASGGTGAHHAIQLAGLSVPAGKSADFFISYNMDGAGRNAAASLAQALQLRQRAIDFWQKAPLPYGHVEIPDARIQALLDASIRNIWQAREIKGGLPAFQVGPTVYRGLWAVDGAFMLEAATMLGANKEARAGVEYELSHQQADGRIEILKGVLQEQLAGREVPEFLGGSWDKFNFSKENGIVLWMALRHAQLTRDKRWLESLWPRLEHVAEYIKQLRAQTLTNETPLDDELVPPGFADGGIDGIIPEYTNVYWNLIGLKAFVAAARWLGKSEAANQWQAEYENFLVVFRRAAQRDLKVDPYGNTYLPTRMDGKDLPQRGQWAFLHALYPGELFATDDPLVRGNLAMLRATEREGTASGTGWLADGIWNTLTSFYAHAWLREGNGTKAAEQLYALANHASPSLVWREEQSLKGVPFEPWGDMPHNWVSAEFVRLAVHLLALDRGSELHLLAGLPPEWIRPGAITRLNEVATPCGSLTMELKISADRRAARLRVAPLPESSCSKIVVHLDALAKDGSAKVLELDPKRRTDIMLTLVMDTAGAESGNAEPDARFPKNAAEFAQLFEQMKDWGRWGRDDQLGAANLITASKRKRAFSLARTGIVVSLAHPYLTAAAATETASPFAGNGLPFEHVMEEGYATDTYKVSYHSFIHSHLDGLCHVPYEGRDYNGYQTAEVNTATGCTRLGVENLKNGVVTRGILIDIPRLRNVPYLEPGTPVFVEDIEAWERKTGLRVSSGDAVFLRTGRWVRWEKQGPWALSQREAGFHASIAPWLKKRGVALVGSDGGLDVLPSMVAGEGLPLEPLHVLAINALGIAILDNHDLEAAAETAARLERWEFLFMTAPLPVTGGTGSPVNSLAIF